MNIKYYLLPIAAAALVVPISQPAIAQTVALEEIVVTARKRDESLMDTPITLSAFSA